MSATRDAMALGLNQAETVVRHRTEAFGVEPRFTSSQMHFDAEECSETLARNAEYS